MNRHSYRRFKQNYDKVKQFVLKENCRKSWFYLGLKDQNLFILEDRRRKSLVTVYTKKMFFEKKAADLILRSSYGME